MRARGVLLLSLVALLAWGTAGWAVSGWRALKATSAPLRAEVKTLERRVAQLEALPPAPRLGPLERTLLAWLAAIPAQATVRLEAAPAGRAGKAARDADESLLAAARPVAGVDGAARVELRLQLPRVGPGGLAPVLATIERWPQRWPLELSVILWDARTNTLALAVAVYGTAATRQGARHGAS